MANDSIIGKVFEGRTVDRVTEIWDNIVEIGFTDHTFHRVHRDEFEAFMATLVDAPEPQVADEEEIVVTQEILDENPVLAEAGVRVGDVGYATNDVPEGSMVNDSPEVNDEIISEETV